MPQGISAFSTRALFPTPPFAPTLALYAVKDKWRFRSPSLANEADAARAQALTDAHSSCCRFSSFVGLVDALLQAQMLELARLALAVAVHQVRGGVRGVALGDCLPLALALAVHQVSRGVRGLPWGTACCWRLLLQCIGWVGVMGGYLLQGWPA